MLQHAGPTAVDPSFAVPMPVQGSGPIDTPVETDFRVLHVVNGEHFAGAERVQSHLGRCLPAFGVEADIACVKPGQFASLLEQQGGAWGRALQAPMDNRFDLRAALRIRDLVHRYEYDLLHAHTPRTAIVVSLASLLTGLPWVYHVHSPAARDSTRGLINRLNSITEKQALRNCSHIITVSESLRWDCIDRGANEFDVTVCPQRRPRYTAAAGVGAGAGWQMGSRDGRLDAAEERTGGRTRSDLAAGPGGTRCGASLHRNVRDHAVRGGNRCQHPTARTRGSRRTRRVYGRCSRRPFRGWTLCCFQACSVRVCRWWCSRRWRPVCR